jgi:hypothetical protein
MRSALLKWRVPRETGPEPDQADSRQRHRGKSQTHDSLAWAWLADARYSYVENGPYANQEDTKQLEVVSYGGCIGIRRW